jgi:uncharacterized membrane protein
MRRLNLVICLLLIAVVCGATLYYRRHLPERVPMHWNFAGQVDAYGSRSSMLWIGPGMMIATLLIGVVLPWLSPQGFDIKRFEPAFNYIITLVVGLCAYIYAIQFTAVLTGEMSVPHMTLSGLCVLMVLLGNQMGKVKRNFFIGVRTPWTLADERVWYATHRLSAKLMVVSGLVGLIALWAGASSWLVLALTAVWAPVAMLYSLVYYKRLERDARLG